jgi:hypothetical protein
MLQSKSIEKRVKHAPLQNKKKEENLKTKGV